MSQPKYYGLNELREMFLHFFETKGHLRLPSFSLIPQNDASLLLINSGMAPMKPFFTGEQEPPRHRVTTCQKCIRTGDIENIGHTARHGNTCDQLRDAQADGRHQHQAVGAQTLDPETACAVPNQIPQGDVAVELTFFDVAEQQDEYHSDDGHDQDDQNRSAYTDNERSISVGRHFGRC